MKLPDENRQRTNTGLPFSEKLVAYPLLACFSFLTINPAFSTLNYGLTVSNPGYTYLSGANVVGNFNNVCGDGMVSSSLPIGFTFIYDGISYTQFQVSDNGELFLGGSYTCNDNCGGTCNFSEKEPANLSAGTDRPAICPLWDDMAFNSNSAKLTYTTTIVAGVKILTVEWLLMDWKYNNSNSPKGGITIQVKLYESPVGQIDFIYKQEAQALGAGVQAPHARIGLMGAAGDYYSTDELGTTPSQSSEFIVVAKPATGIQLRWTQGAGGLPIELLFFQGVYAADKFVSLKWATATETDNNYFTLFRSTAAGNFKPIGKVKGAGNSLTLRTYGFTDTSVPDSFNVFYYYLRQTDFNGSAVNSAIITVNTLKEKPPNIYFNEDTHQLIISYNFSKQEDYMLHVMDMSGRSVCERKIGLADRRNNFFSEPLLLSRDGIYIARFFTADGNILSQTKFLKQ
jgi:hypothetical protein